MKQVFNKKIKLVYIQVKYLSSVHTTSLQETTVSIKHLMSLRAPQFEWVLHVNLPIAVLLKFVTGKVFMVALLRKNGIEQYS